MRDESGATHARRVKSLLGVLSVVVTSCLALTAVAAEELQGRDLALALFHGEGIPRDFARAYEVASKMQNDPVALYITGHCHETGDGAVRRDSDLAAKHFSRALALTEEP